MGFQWNEMHLMVRDMMKKFCAEELIPNLDALDTEQMLPYPIMRKMFDSFGMAEMSVSRAATRISAKLSQRTPANPNPNPFEERPNVDN